MLCLRIFLTIGLVLCPLQTIFAQTSVNEPFGGKPLKDDIRPEDVIHWEAVGGTIQASRKSIEVGIRLTTENGFTVYRERLKFQGGNGFVLGKVEYPPIKQIVDPISGKQTDVFEGGEFLVTFDSTTALSGSKFDFSVESTGCTQVICLFPHNTQLSVEVSPATQTASAPASGTAYANTETPATSEGHQSLGQRFDNFILNNFKAKGTPFGLVLLFIFLGGLASNLTPCVYPMIPITIRILSNTGHPLWFAFLYGTGIVFTYTGLGVFAGLTGSMFGKFMQSSLVNLSFGTLMAILGLGMLGFGNLGALQALGSRLGAGKPSPRNTFLMGLGAGLVAAPCTGPIMLALLGYAAKQGGLLDSVLVFLVYSSGFALPYVFLGASTAKISKRTFSHHIQVAVKIIFAAVMFALALYYLRIPFYTQLKSLDLLWPQIALISGIAGALLTLLFVMRPNLENDKRALIVPTMVLGLALFGAYKTISVNTGTLHWIKNEADAFAESSQSHKPVFLDGWAEWCLACIEMDKTTFVNPQVIQELSDHWVLLKLDLTESNETNDKLIEKYGFQGLPSFAMMKEGGTQDASKTLAGKMEPEQLLPELEKFRTENK